MASATGTPQSSFPLFLWLVVVVRGDFRSTFMLGHGSQNDHAIRQQIFSCIFWSACMLRPLGWQPPTCEAAVNQETASPY